MDGWIKLYRRIQDDALYKELTAVQRDIMINLLLMVNHRPSEWIFEGEKYTCNAGEMITSLKKIQEKCAKGTSIQQVRTCLLKLERYGFLTSKSTNKNRLISIVNWSLYQDDTDNVTSKLTSNQQADNKQLTPNKNVRMQEDIYVLDKSNTLSETDAEFTVSTQSQSPKGEVEKVVAVWNECGKFRQVSKVTSTSKRGKMLVARIREYGLDKVLECVNTASRSSFLASSEFFTFDWFVRPNNFIKVLEGNYNDRSDKGDRDRQYTVVGENEKSKSRFAKYGKLSDI